jgi:hypothetical protein
MIKIFSRKTSRLAFFVIAMLLAPASSAFAQQDLSLELPSQATPSATNWFGLPVRVGCFAASMIVAWAFGFYVIFPFILDRPNAMRPLQAYGLTAGLIWVAWCASALLIFQDMLVLNFAIEGTAREFVNQWMLTCSLCVAALIGFALLRMIFGSRSASTEY